MLLLKFIEHTKEVLFKRVLVLLWRKKLQADILKLPATVGVFLRALKIAPVVKQLVCVDPRQIFLLLCYSAHSECLLDQAPVQKLLPRFNSIVLKFSHQYWTLRGHKEQRLAFNIEADFPQEVSIRVGVENNLLRDERNHCDRVTVQKERVKLGKMARNRLHTVFNTVALFFLILDQRKMLFLKQHLFFR